METNTTTYADQLALVPKPRQAESAPVITAEREATLRALLDGPYEPGHSYGNYEYALDSGLIDMFDYDPQTGEDGLVHTLSGIMQTGPDGAVTTEGFHHEPSGVYGPATELGKTEIDRTHIASLKSDKRRFYQEYPFEPYVARANIGGIRKTAAQTDQKTGEVKIVESKNNMFPKEYDALAVLQAVRIARENQIEDSVKIATNGKLIVQGYAPMIDGESLMKVQLVLDPTTKKVRSAFPVVKMKGVMHLADEAIEKALWLR